MTTQDSIGASEDISPASRDSMTWTQSSAAPSIDALVPRRPGTTHRTFDLYRKPGVSTTESQCWGLGVALGDICHCSG